MDDVKMDASETAEGIRGYFKSLADTLAAVDTEPLAEMTRMILEAQQNGNSIFTMGNGGHANTAAHMINDIAKHTISSDDKTEVVAQGKRFRTMCLNDSVSLMTGVANDMGYEHVFSEQLENWCRSGDVVIGISGSGNSENILRAFETAKARGAKTLCLAGKDGGAARQAADLCIVVPSGKMVQIEDVHLAISHAVADELKKAAQGRAELEG